MEIKLVGEMRMEKKTMTVLEKWTMDITDMEEKVRTLQRSANGYKVKFGEDIRILTNKVTMQQKSSERYWVKFRDDVEKMKANLKNFESVCHQKIKEIEKMVAEIQNGFNAYALKFRKAVKDMATHIWGMYEAVP